MKKVQFLRDLLMARTGSFLASSALGPMRLRLKSPSVGGAASRKSLARESHKLSERVNWIVHLL